MVYVDEELQHGSDPRRRLSELTREPPPTLTSIDITAEDIDATTATIARIDEKCVVSPADET
jgi:hypothetical protein